MSASSQSLSRVAGGADVLGDLLHSLSQPLTSLRCSLECSIEQVAEQQQASVLAALQQTEQVIGMIQLMREYLDADGAGPEGFSSALAPVLRSVIEELSSVAEVRGVQLCLAGSCTAVLPVAEARLRLALQYLLTGAMETQAAGGRVLLRLSEGPAGAVLRVEGEPGFREMPAAALTLRGVRLAIASRVLECAGASLVLGDGSVGFVLRTSHRG
jgi:signal transduction histidine kinase